MITRPSNSIRLARDGMTIESRRAFSLARWFCPFNLVVHAPDQSGYGDYPLVPSTRTDVWQPPPPSNIDRTPLPYCSLPIICMACIPLDEKVNFPYDCTFNENSVMSDENSPSGSGGAVFVDHGGAVLFEGVCDFIYNEVGSGGRGGAIANMGSVVFQGSPGEISFTDNTATGEFERMPSPAVSVDIFRLVFLAYCLATYNSALGRHTGTLYVSGD